jgi:peptide/nickel transport system permease protein
VTAQAPLRLTGLLAGIMLVAPWLAPYDAMERFPQHPNAPPMRAHLDARGVYFVPLQVTNLLTQQFQEVPGARVSGPWQDGPPVFLLGADALGRDVFSRTLHGARASLGLALVATLGTLLVGALLGAWAGLAGGRVGMAVGKLGDVLLVLPLLYAIVALRTALPLVLPLSAVVTSLALFFVALGWPRVARGVQAIVSVEAQQEHVLAATALGASRWRLLTRHLLPACTGFLAVQAALLVPTFVLTEATLSYVGLGFPDGVPSWGTALTDAANVAALTRAPWTLAPAGAIFAVVLVTNLILDPAREDGAAGAARVG